jgi:hypothetical protein
VVRMNEVIGDTLRLRSVARGTTAGGEHGRPVWELRGWFQSKADICGRLRSAAREYPLWAGSRSRSSGRRALDDAKGAMATIT